MRKMVIILLVLAILSINTLNTLAEEQPLARIVICDVNGNNCHVTDNNKNEYKEVQACENIVLKSDSYDPLGQPLTEVKWIIKEEGNEKAKIFQGEQLNFTCSAKGYVKVALNVSNGVFSHETFITMIVKENKVPKIIDVTTETGLDKQKTVFESKQQQKVVETVPGIPVKIWRRYEERKDRDVLRPGVIADPSILILESKGYGSEWEMTLNFSKYGTFPITFEDINFCLISEP